VNKQQESHEKQLNLLIRSDPIRIPEDPILGLIALGIRDNTTNQVDYDFWNRKVQQSQMEISIINLLIAYMNGEDM
jgi:hypothetical protein